MLNNCIHPAKSESIFISVYQKSSKQTFKIVFWVQNHLLICVLVLLICKGFYEVNKLVWNVRIKAFWYIKYNFLYLTKLWRVLSFSVRETPLLLKNENVYLFCHDVTFWYFLFLLSASNFLERIEKEKL